ncbi:LruC domain-containing protein [Shewanella sp. NIFS-20-20]|uniref:LruC domain-containing protein n=1 Tax=Shewanella sp. NIFS-20-20 TaxID=2853806 RepID=UPI00210B043F|nr:LruC domain-containing protein [Shewanella sp. NIFS-20-20]
MAKIKVSGKLAAIGASYQNGFAIRLPNVDLTAINGELTYLTINGQRQAHSGLELDMTEASFVISENLNADAGYNCQYFRTQATCREDINLEFELNIGIAAGADTLGLPPMPYDPFIFATPGTYHGDDLPNHPGRSLEIHLADQSPTEKFDTVNIMGKSVDDSDPASGKYFKTANNLPWALMLPETWAWPLERVDLLKAYPNFEEYTVSGGNSQILWFKGENAVAAQCY